MAQQSSTDRVANMTEEEFDNLSGDEFTNFCVDSVIEMLEGGMIPPEKLQELYDSIDKWSLKMQKQTKQSAQKNSGSSNKSNGKGTQKKGSGKGKGGKKSDTLYTVARSKKMSGVTVRFLQRKSTDDTRSIVEVMTGNASYPQGKQVSVKNDNLSPVEK